MTGRRFWGAIGVCAAIFAITAVASPLIGSTRIDYSRAFAGLSPDREILFYARLPRVLLKRRVHPASLTQDAAAGRAGHFLALKKRIERHRARAAG